MQGEQLSRRRLIGSAAFGVVAATPATAFAVNDLVEADPSAEPGDPDPRTDHIIEARGPHQAGIATPQQDHACFAGFALRTTDAVRNLRAVLTRWTPAIDRLTRGEALVEAADGLDPARSTITVGFGPRVFSLLEKASERPRHLRELPAFRGDRLDPAACGGDLIVQLCADDAQVVSAALQALRRLGADLVDLRWTRQGFLSRPEDGGTPRNLMGHKDGTTNPRPATKAFEQAVWVTDPGEPEWFRGGTYLVFRTIRMRLADWQRTPRSEQDKAIGRRVDTGAPLSGGGEFAKARAESLPEGSHVALAVNTPMLRRGYNYDDGTDAGLLFAAYLNDPRRFVTLQQTLASFDRLRAFVEHTGSAIAAVPPGAERGARLADRLLSGR